MPRGWSIQTTLERWCQEYLLGIGWKVPGCQEIGPFSWRNSAREEQPGPPESHMMISLFWMAVGFVEGKNQKKSSPEVVLEELTGRRPA